MLERKCVQCGRNFTLEDSEIEFYKKKNLNLPKRCKHCRNRNKNNNRKNENDKNKWENNNKKNNYIENNDIKNNYIGSNENNHIKNDYIGSNENAEKSSKNNTGIWKVFIAAIAVIIGLFVGIWPNYNSNEQADSNNLSIEDNSNSSSIVSYTFRSDEDLSSHFEKHGNEFDYKNEAQYLEGANRVVNSPDALHKKEKEDGDDIYYIESSNEFVVVSTDAYIRTYFKPDKGIEYYNKQ